MPLFASDDQTKNPEVQEKHPQSPENNSSKLNGQPWPGNGKVTYHAFGGQALLLTTLPVLQELTTLPVLQETVNLDKVEQQKQHASCEKKIARTLSIGARQKWPVCPVAVGCLELHLEHLCSKLELASGEREGPSQNDVDPRLSSTPAY